MPAKSGDDERDGRAWSTALKGFVGIGGDIAPLAQRARRGEPAEQPVRQQSHPRLHRRVAEGAGPVRGVALARLLAVREHARSGAAADQPGLRRALTAASRVARARGAVRAGAVCERRRDRVARGVSLERHAGSASPERRGRRRSCLWRGGRDGRLGVRSGGGARAGQRHLQRHHAGCDELPPVGRPDRRHAAARGRARPAESLRRRNTSWHFTMCAFRTRVSLGAQRRARTAHRDRRARLRPRGAQQPLGGFQAEL